MYVIHLLPSSSILNMIFFCRPSFVSNNERYQSLKNSNSSFQWVISGKDFLTYGQPAVSFCFYDLKRAEIYRNS
jgi:hypothetical protein